MEIMSSISDTISVHRNIPVGVGGSALIYALAIVGKGMFESTVIQLQ